MTTIKGHCVCKRYSVTIKDVQRHGVNLCHCVDCRRWAGSMYSAHIMAPAESVELSGPEPRTYTVKGVDGNDMTRAWCDGCGSGLWIRRGEGVPTAYKAGLFNPGDVPRPDTEVFTKDMESWEKVQEGVKAFRGNLEK